MNRIVRLFAIVPLVLTALPLGAASAQEAGGIELEVAEEIVLQATLDLIRGGGQPIRATIESPFDDVFAGSAGMFTAVAESRAAAGQGLGDQIPFADADVWSLVSGYRPTSNDYFVNSPYTLANVIEVTESVSSCGATEYREVALFLTRNGMPTIGENPNVPNDPGVGASEAVSLVCAAGQTSTLFILPQDNTVAQFATPYPVFELDLDGRHFVVFITLDPFATYQVVASFATDTTDQAQFGFLRGESSTYPAVTDPADGGIPDEDVAAAIDALVDELFLGSNEAPPEVVTDPDLDADPVDDSDTETPANETPANETPANEAPANEAPATEDTPAATGETAEDQAATQQSTEPSSEDDSSPVPAIVVAVAATAVAGTAFAIKRKKKVVTQGYGKPLLSDAEEIRLAGERTGLPLERGWQQIPYAVGREFRLHESGVTTREHFGDEDREGDVSFEGHPWQWKEASNRNLDMTNYFAFWINDEGTLRVGNPTEPYQYDRLRDESDYPVDYVEEPAVQPYDRKAEGSATTFDENELPPA